MVVIELSCVISPVGFQYSTLIVSSSTLLEIEIRMH